MELPKSITALNRRFPKVKFVRNRHKDFSCKPIGVVNRVDQSVIFCDKILIIDVPWYCVERGVPIVAADDLICAVAFNYCMFEKSFHSFLVRNKIRRTYVE